MRLLSINKISYAPYVAIVLLLAILIIPDNGRYYLPMSDRKTTMYCASYLISVYICLYLFLRVSICINQFTLLPFFTTCIESREQ